MKLSQGVMNEFAYLGLAHTLLKSSELTEEFKDDLPIDSFKPLITDYHDNKRINRRLEKLLKQIEAIMKPALYHKSPFYPKVQGLGLELMSIAPQEVQGELLALYILWYRFQPHERDKPLHEMFKPLSEKHSEDETFIETVKLALKVANERNIDVSVEDMMGNVVQVVRYKRDTK